MSDFELSFCTKLYIKFKIYTSYFGNSAELERNNCVIVGICCFPPKDLKYNLKIVAPTKDILDEKSSYSEYYKMYRDVLYGFNIADFFNELEHISDETGGKDIALCCYEKPGEFCHRHLLADFLNMWVPKMDCHEFSAKDIKIKEKSIELF